MNPDILQAVLGIFTADAGISGVATVATGDRRPQDTTPPAITAWVVTEDALNHLEGALGMDQARIQVDANGVSRWQANNLAWLAWQALDGIQGVFGGVEIKGSHRITGVRHVTNRVLAGSDQYGFIASQDFRLTYTSIAKVV